MLFCSAVVVSHTEKVYNSPISLKGLMELLSVPKNRVCLPTCTEPMMFPSGLYVVAKSAAFQFNLMLLQVHSQQDFENRR